LLLSLTTLSLLLAQLLPTNKLFCLMISSVFTSLVFIECGKSWAWLFYLAASILALWLFPLGPVSLAYFVFFGNWGLVRTYLSKGPKYFAQPVKLIYFNCLLLLSYWLALFLGLSVQLSFSHPLLVVWLGAQAGLLLYDRAFEAFLAYYKSRFQTK